MTLGEKERLLSEVEKEREVWRQRDRALATVLQEKDVAIGYLKQELERRPKDGQVTVTHSNASLLLEWRGRSLFLSCCCCCCF